MTEPIAIELTEFEQVEAAPGTALLRVAARPTSEMRPDERPTLMVDDGQRVHRLAALPAPPDPGGLLRAAFSAPTALLRPASHFSLELSNRAVVELPAPTHRAARPVVAGPAPAPPSDEQLRVAVEARADLERRLREAIAETAELKAANEAAISAAASCHERARQLEEQLEQLRTDADRLRTELDEADTRAETLAEVVRRESGRRESVEQELAALRAQLNGALAGRNGAEADARDVTVDDR